MIPKGAVRHAIALIFLALACFPRDVSLYAIEAFPAVASPPPGIYAAPCQVAFSAPRGCRLLVGLGGEAPSEISGPLLFSVPDGTERTFSVQAELRGLEPSSPVISRATLVWTIDRKRPSEPVYSARSADGGRTFTIAADGASMITCRMYHPFSGSLATVELSPGEAFFVPDGASLCAFATDAAGNRGPSSSPSIALPDAGSAPFAIVNPVPGNWANSQVLLVDAAPGILVRYSTDGSDPAVSGLVWDGPVEIESSGLTTIRVFAEDSAGVPFESRVLYSVNQRERPEGLPFPRQSGPILLGDFEEISLPAGLLWSFGDSVPASPGGKPVLISAVRGTVRYYPLTITDGTSVWRWICSSGTARDSGGAQTPDSSPASVPLVRIHDWYFISIESASPAYYSRDGISWSAYESPVFVERTADSVLYWYSTGWKGAAVQTVRLPARPAIAGSPPSPVSGTPVFLSVTDSPFSFTYEIGSKFAPARPVPGSPDAGGGILFEVPNGAASTFFVRFLATCDGLEHGELAASFTLDRKAPRTPRISLFPDTGLSRSPVALRVDGEDMVQVSIEPPLFTMDGPLYLLGGDPSRAVDYTVTVFSVDRAGNRSAVAERKLTILRNALLVDSSVMVAGIRDGTPAAPFANLDDALDAVSGDTPWRIEIRGETSLERAHSLSSDVRISASGAVIRTVPEAGFAVRDSLLSVSGCSFVSSGTGDSRSIPLFDIRAGTFEASGIDVSVLSASSPPLIHASASRLSCADSRFSLSADEYVILADLTDSALALDSSTLTVSARNSSVLSLLSSSCVLSRSRFVSVGGTAARAIEAWSSSVSLDDMILERRDAPEGNRDTALWCDASSGLPRINGLAVTGYWRETASGSTRHR